VLAFVVLYSAIINIIDSKEGKNSFLPLIFQDISSRRAFVLALRDADLAPFCAGSWDKFI
jgi:hypothetical protein